MKDNTATVNVTCSFVRQSVTVCSDVDMYTKLSQYSRQLHSHFVKCLSTITKRRNTNQSYGIKMMVEIHRQIHPLCLSHWASSL